MDLLVTVLAATVDADVVTDDAIEARFADPTVASVVVVVLALAFLDLRDEDEIM